MRPAAGAAKMCPFEPGRKDTFLTRFLRPVPADVRQSEFGWLTGEGDVIITGLIHLPGAMPMTDVTRILSQIESGDPSAAEQLLPLVYDELRKLAAAKLAQERPGQTLQATALVHDAYIRLVDVEQTQHWDSRGHFFAAAAEAMRRILVERARRHASLKRGAEVSRVELDEQTLACDDQTFDLLTLDEALRKLDEHDPEAGRLVKLRFFAGLGHQEAASAMGLGRRAADRLWALARAWLFRELDAS